MAIGNESSLLDPSFNYLESPLDGVNRTPITYYGGKQSMASLILSLIPDHKLYCEPFLGGAAIFFAKQRSEVEVINDINREVVNFYKVCRLDFDALNKLIQATPHSRMMHRQARYILKSRAKRNKLNRAWAFWVQTNMSFGSVIFGGYSYDRQTNKIIKKFVNKKFKFTSEIRERLKGVSIECNDALQVIQSHDTRNSFFYLDPPYFNADMGHYGGYTEKDFTNLLELLSKIKGQFLLSSYPSVVLTSHTKKNGWAFHSIQKNFTVRDAKKAKTEVLTANYDIHTSLDSNQKGRGRETLSGIDYRCLQMKANELMLLLILN